MADWPEAPQANRKVFLVVRQVHDTSELGELVGWQILEAEPDRTRALEAIQETVADSPEVLEFGPIRLIEATVYDLDVRTVVQATVQTALEAEGP